MNDLGLTGLEDKVMLHPRTSQHEVGVVGPIEYATRFHRHCQNNAP